MHKKKIVIEIKEKDRCSERGDRKREERAERERERERDFGRRKYLWTR